MVETDFFRKSEQWRPLSPEKAFENRTLSVQSLCGSC